MREIQQNLNLAVTDHTFEQEVLNTKTPVLVDFWADWCGPCHAVAPVIEALAAEYDGSVKVRKLNVDENPQTARQFAIRSIPTLMVFQDGDLKETLVGVQPKSRIANAIEQYLQ